MREIPLSNRPELSVLIDDEDFELVSDFRWRANHNGYAIAYVRGSKPHKQVFMHRLIVGTPEGMVTDHIDGNILNNRRSNLRICTHAENCRNQITRLQSKHSEYKGVTWFFNKRTMLGYWMAGVAGKTIGYFNSEVEAALAYDAKATEIFGRFAKVNFNDLAMLYTHVLNRGGRGVRSPLDA